MAAVGWMVPMIGVSARVPTGNAGSPQNVPGRAELGAAAGTPTVIRVMVANRRRRPGGGRRGAVSGKFVECRRRSGSTGGRFDNERQAMRSVKLYFRIGTVLFGL